jgi:uncharacterized protein (DUF2252 family)
LSNSQLAAKQVANTGNSANDRAARLGVLRTARDLKMARSTHAYVRGSTASFYEWLANSPDIDLIPNGPSMWICGDCHVGNLGPIAGAHGRIDIQIRDLYCQPASKFDPRSAFNIDPSGAGVCSRPAA